MQNEIGWQRFLGGNGTPNSEGGTLGHVTPPLDSGVTDTAVMGQRRSSRISEGLGRQHPKWRETKMTVSLVSEIVKDLKLSIGSLRESKSWH